ncbi:hypothetical protein [Pedobacter sp. ASV12]|uniref:hypothetical protein n=1 Tax=Pedobacter sp. ASV12 TaxID=2795120 RepID=UPI0018EA79C4|nr:hypothetical protein [Pedobacter sp. ASV12]
MGKVLTIICFVVILIAVGVVVHFVGGVSRQTPPIQNYEYQGSINELVEDISNYTKLKSNGKYFITDTVGNIHEDYAIRLTIELKVGNDTIEYELKIEPQNKAVMPIKTNVYLTMAYNKTTVSGGYQAESPGIKPLVDFFNSDFLSSLKKLHKVE